MNYWVKNPPRCFIVEPDSNRKKKHANSLFHKARKNQFVTKAAL